MYHVKLDISMACIEVFLCAGQDYTVSAKTPQGIYDKLLKCLLTEHYEYEGREAVEYIQVPNEDALLPAILSLSKYLHKYMVEFHKEYHDFDFVITYPNGKVVELSYPDRVKE